MEAPQGEDAESARLLAEIDQKIDHLMSALAEGSSLTMTYINRTIQKLEAQRQEVLAKQAQIHTKKQVPKGKRLQFAPLSFEQKKIVAAQFIREIKLDGDRAEVVWKI